MVYSGSILEPYFITRILSTYTRFLLKNRTHNKQEVIHITLKIIKIIPENLLSKYKGSSSFFSAGMTIEEHVGQCKTRTK
jgi:hypothetical protein